MKRAMLIGFAACAFVAMPAFSVSAMPIAPAHSVIDGTDSSVILAKGGHGHGGHWARGRSGRAFGWSRGGKVGCMAGAAPLVFGSKGAAEQTRSWKRPCSSAGPFLSDAQPCRLQKTMQASVR